MEKKRTLLAISALGLAASPIADLMSQPAVQKRTKRTKRAPVIQRVPREHLTPDIVKWNDEVDRKKAAKRARQNRERMLAR